MDSFETLQTQSLDTDILQVRLNRPDAANALNTRMGRDLLALFMGLNADPRQARCIILSGTGERAFCAGGDLKERNGMTDAQWQDQHLIFEQMIRAIIDCPIPVVAAVNGAAYGGGLEIALGCDFIYASRTARFALTEVTQDRRQRPGRGAPGQARRPSRARFVARQRHAARDPGL
jgi:enoyl-CoA hydratase/carnithine racemase